MRNSHLSPRAAIAFLVGTALLALVTTSTPAQVPTASGSFSGGTIAAGGVSIVAFTGTTAQLNAAGAAVNGVSVTAAVGGRSVIFVINAPSFVNADFNAAFPTGLSGTLVIVKTQVGIGANAPPPGAAPAEVVSVVDGDTLDVRLDGATQRVRLILVDTPEVFGGSDCFGPEASAFTKRTLPAGTRISLERDVSETDRFGRLLRYVYLVDGRMFNEVLIAEGYAQVATFPPDLRHQTRLLAAQRIARDARTGLWGACGLAPIPTAVASPTPPTPPALLYDPFGPDRDCGDFPSHAQAQAFYLAAGGPATDRHGLDSDGDGLACESLP